MQTEFQGLFPAIITPMTADGDLNEDAYRKVMEFNIQAGVAGFWVAGGTGESILLDDEENRRVAEIVTDQSQGRVKNIMHIGAPTTTRSAKMAEHAAKVGVEAICCVPPFFYRRSDDEIVEHYRIVAAAADFIKKLPHGYETVIGENGIKLSGGQKQRISIARAVLKNSPIILLDEATSSLDAESEEKVQNAVMSLTKNKTTLVIAHRLSTIIRADKIILVNRGEVADFGTHSELLKSSMIYKNLYSKQLSA